MQRRCMMMIYISSLMDQSDMCDKHTIPTTVTVDPGKTLVEEEDVARSSKASQGSADANPKSSNETNGKSNQNGTYLL